MKVGRESLPQNQPVLWQEIVVLPTGEVVSVGPPWGVWHTDWNSYLDYLGNLWVYA